MLGQIHVPSSFNAFSSMNRYFSGWSFFNRPMISCVCHLVPRTNNLLCGSRRGMMISLNHSYKSSNNLFVVSFHPLIKSSQIHMSTSVPVIVPPTPTRFIVPRNSPLPFSNLNEALACSALDR